MKYQMTFTNESSVSITFMRTGIWIKPTFSTGISTGIQFPGSVGDFFNILDVCTELNVINTKFYVRASS